ncbi:MAG: methyltransferase domain-containing protein [Alphaproteobacteria bacterium]|nr:methyltransferase domain-containing protein [Alphaproteobacteria bacterium]
MHSQEMGLLLAQKLLKLDDLHYGYWDQGLEVNIQNLYHAQARYSDILFGHIDALTNNNKNASILDVGCGVGENIKKLVDRGYAPDGLVPSQWMLEQCQLKSERPIYHCIFEDFPDTDKRYDLVFFSESFQYVDMDKSFTLLQKMLNENGKILLLDFFTRDDIAGRSALGGGHSMAKFYQAAQQHGFRIIDEQDITQYVSPNLQLVHDILGTRIVPSLQILDEFLSAKSRFFYGTIFKMLFRKKLEKLRFKYGASRNAENFEKYKIYKIISLTR